MGSRIPIGPGIEEGEPCSCQGAPRAVSSGRVDFEIRAPQIAANAVLNARPEEREHQSQAEEGERVPAGQTAVSSLSDAAGTRGDKIGGGGP